MRILILVGSYRPVIGGLPAHAEHVAEGMAARGHSVTVLTPWHDHEAPRRETVAGVHIERVVVRGTVSRIPIVPGLIPRALRLLARVDVVAVWIPMIDAGAVCALARLVGRSTVLSYFYEHEAGSDARVRLGQAAVEAMNTLAVRASAFVVVANREYAERSRVLAKVVDRLRVITPVVALPRATNGTAWTRPPTDGPVVAMAARIAPEKGIEHLLAALPLLADHYPFLRVKMTGTGRPDIGCEAYFETIRPLLERLGDRVEFVGVLDRGELPGFLAAADVVAVPSVDAREAFGMVQVEAMLSGTPVVASDLPGMREPVARTGMGRLVPAGRPDALADAIRSILEDPERFVRSPEVIRRLFDADETLDRYEELLREAAGPAEHPESDRGSQARPTSGIAGSGCGEGRRKTGRRPAAPSRRWASLIPRTQRRRADPGRTPE